LLADLLPALKQPPPHLGRMRQVPLGLAGSLPPSAAKGPGASLGSRAEPYCPPRRALPLQVLLAWGAACPAAPTGATRCCRVLVCRAPPAARVLRPIWSTETKHKAPAQRNMETKIHQRNTRDSIKIKRSEGTGE